MKNTKCPVCTSPGFTILFSNAIDRMHGYPGIFSYVRCDTCGHVWLNPRPKSNDMNSYYPDDYRLHMPLGGKPKRPATTPFSLSPVTRAEKLLERLITKDSIVLDVGCGRGDFLAKLRDKTGCRSYGIDFSANAVKTAKECYDLDLFCGQLKDAPYLDKTFDLITMWWYLEHDPYPLKTLTKCRKLLKEDGWAIFGVPNYASLNAKLFKTKWYHLDPPRHLSIFSPNSAKTIVEKAGFVLDHVDWDKSTWGTLGTLQYAIFGRGYDVPFRIPDCFMFRLLSFPMTILLSMLRFSDVITIYARVKPTKAM